MPKTDLRVIKTRSIIRSALVDIMAQKPISRITISEICALARINRKTFYRHYRAVGDVLEEIENEYLEEFSKNLQSRSLLDIGAVMRAVSETVKLHRDFFGCVMKCNSGIFMNGRMKLALRRTLIAALKNNGAKISGSEISAVSEFVVSGMLSLYAQWFLNGCREDIDALSEIAVKTAANGLSAYLPNKF